MAKFETLKQSIAQVIKPNGAQEITGQVMQDTLFSILNVVGTKYAFGGIVTPQTNPEFLISDVPSFFIGGAGTYQYFGDPITVNDGQIGVFLWDNAFHSAAVTVVSGDTIMTTPSDQEVTGRKDFRGNITVKDEIMFLIQGLFQHFIKATQWLLKFTDYVSGNEFDMDFQNGKLQRKFLGATSTYLTNTDLADPSNEVTDVAMNGILSGTKGEIEQVNQLVENGDFSNGVNGFTCSYGSLDVVNGRLRQAATFATDSFLNIRINTILIASHKYLVDFGNIDYNFGNGYGGRNMNIVLQIAESPWTYPKTKNIGSQPIGSTTFTNIITEVECTRFQLGALYMSGDCSITIDRFRIYDLTAMFGTGLEPTTADEFARRLGYASIDDVPYIPYTSTPIPYNDALSVGSDLLVKRQIGSHEGKLKLVGQLDGVRGGLQDIFQNCPNLQASNYWECRNSNTAVVQVAFGTASQSLATVTVISGTSPADWALQCVKNSLMFMQGEKYLVIAEMKANTATEFMFRDTTLQVPYGDNFNVTTAWQAYGQVITAPQGDCSGLLISPTTQAVSYQVRKAQVFNLTIMFGAGNEPKTLEEFTSAMGYASPMDIHFYQETEILQHQEIGDAILPFAGNIAQGGDTFYLGGCKMKYDKWTNTLTVTDLNGNPSTISSQ